MPTVLVIEIEPLSELHTPDLLTFMRFVKV